MSSLLDMPIIAEDDVPRRRPKPKSRGGAPRDPKLAAYIQKLCDMRPGQSCFFAGMNRLDVEFLRRPAISAGINLTIREVERDEIHAMAGVRVWRDAGEYDEL